jgi:hypothetical protein
MLSHSIGSLLIILGVAIGLTAFCFYALRLKLQGDTLYNNQAGRLVISLFTGVTIAGIGFLIV